MKYLLIAMLAGLISCSGSPNKFQIGDQVMTKKRCMATSTESAYNRMQDASDRRDESPLQEMMDRGELLILNEGQPGKVTWPDKERSQVQIIGGSKWWVANHFLKDR